MKLLGRQTMIGLVTGMLAMGCQKPPPPPPPVPPPMWKVPVDRTAQVSELSQRVNTMKEQVAALAGQSQEQHRQSVSDILDNLSKILRLAQGTSTPPQFINRINLVEEAEAVIAQPDMATSRSEASENEAVRASLDILDVVIARDAADDQQLPPLLNSARIKLDAMYGISGPMHDLAAKEGLEEVGRVLDRLSDDLSAKFSAAPAAQ